MYKVLEEVRGSSVEGFHFGCAEIFGENGAGVRQKGEGT